MKVKDGSRASEEQPMTDADGQLRMGSKPKSGSIKIRSFSRHRTLATMPIYRDERDRSATQRTLADIVASTLGARAATPY